MKGKKLPYKRYSIGPVFRDEPVSGNRLRQFTQCDIDIVGADIKDEAEILAIVKRILTDLKINFKIYINNRKLLNEILFKENIEKMDWKNVIREIDKLDKLPEDEIYNNLRGYGAQNVLEIFKQPESFFEKYDSYKEIKELKNYCEVYGVEVIFSPSLARGLSYYNGNIFEVKSDIKESITAGGSFMFNEVQSTGISFGLERLCVLAELNESNKKIMIISINQDKQAILTSELLRDKNISCILSTAKLRKSLDYANSKNIDFVILIGENEIKTEKLKLRNMKTGKESDLTFNEVIKNIKDD